MKKIPLITAIALLSGTSGWSTEVSWETHGPVTRYGITALALAPSMAQVLFAGSDSGGLFKSIDEGMTWNTLWPQAAEASVTHHVSQIAVDPHHPEIVYVAVDNYLGSWEPGGVYKSEDGGHTWTAVNEGLPNPRVNFLMSDPQRSGVLYAGVMGSLYKSVDHGVTWRNVLLSMEVTVLAISPQNSDLLYVGGRGVLKSTDGGAHWLGSDSGLFDEVILSALTVDANDPRILFAGGTPRSGPEAPGRIFKSVDGGLRWVEVAQVGTWLRTLAIDPTDSRIVYVGSSGKGGTIGTFLSTDGGMHWQRMHVGGAHSLIVAPQQPRRVYAGMRTQANGVYRFTVDPITAVEEVGWGGIKAMFR